MDSRGLGVWKICWMESGSTSSRYGEQRGGGFRGRGLLLSPNSALINSLQARRPPLRPRGGRCKAMGRRRSSEDGLQALLEQWLSLSAPSTPPSPSLQPLSLSSAPTTRPGEMQMMYLSCWSAMWPVGISRHSAPCEPPAAPLTAPLLLCHRPTCPVSAESTDGLCHVPEACISEGSAGSVWAASGAGYGGSTMAPLLGAAHSNRAATHGCSHMRRGGADAAGMGDSTLGIALKARAEPDVTLMGAGVKSLGGTSQERFSGGGHATRPVPAAPPP